MVHLSRFSRERSRSGATRVKVVPRASPSPILLGSPTLPRRAGEGYDGQALVMPPSIVIVWPVM
jgi:hypothetical protein